MSVIKGYTIQGILAKGGMATIYIAQQESLKRQVALKVLNPKLDTVILDHFLDESRIIASLKHPNIIPVYDVGRVGIHFYHAMEYLEGGDLEARIAQKQIDVHTALEIILELSDALYLVHSKGIIHSDIKPANIVFRSDDCPVLTDFGIFKRVDTTGKEQNAEGILTSPTYASPELIQGHHFDHRTDIYSLGIVLYEMLVGEKPFKGETKLEMIASSIQDPIPTLPEHLMPLQPLMDHMLAKDPDERIADGRMISRYLKKYLRDHPRSTQTAQNLADDSGFSSKVVVEYVPESKPGIKETSSKALVPLLIVLFSIAVHNMVLYHLIFISACYDRFLSVQYVLI